jgi:hypothetical protein
MERAVVVTMFMLVCPYIFFFSFPPTSSLFSGFSHIIISTYGTHTHTHTHTHTDTHTHTHESQKHMLEMTSSIKILFGIMSIKVKTRVNFKSWGRTGCTERINFPPSPSHHHHHWHHHYLFHPKKYTDITL